MSDIKNIVVTGAGRGIGLELTKQLVIKGHRVFATRRNPADTKDLMTLMLSYSDQLSLHTLDVNSLDSCIALADDLGDTRIDVLINNAGILDTYDSNIDNMDFDSFAKVLDVNTLGPLRVLQALMPHIRRSANESGDESTNERSSALVLNLSSQMGSLAGDGVGAHAYRTSKAALNKAMNVISRELYEENICIINAHPGWVQTDMGGSQADIDVSTSARGLIDLLDKELQDTGGFFDYKGDSIDW